MRTLKYFLLTLIVSCLYACTAEEIVTPDSNLDIEGDETAVIAISSKDLLPIDMNKTRADLNSILSKVNDLNICVSLNDGSYIFYYCTDKIQSGKTYKGEYIDPNNLKNINTTGTQIHCDITASQIKKIEVIANKGEAINNITSWKSMQETESNNFLANNYCMMYGVATTSTADNTHTTISGKTVKCKLYNINLKRTRAMVSVKINNAGLKTGVEIIPKKIRLCNVPTSCTLTNLITDSSKPENSGSNAISSKSDCVKISQERDITEGILKGSIGVHADNHIPANFKPFYMFENMQGATTNNKIDATKYPQGITSVADAKDPNKNFKYSYIEIDADYKYKDKGTVKVGGNIIYRFFLGKDAKNDFNIEGNHYYKLTLNLKRFGGAKEDGKVDNKGNLIVNKDDVSWRVDMNTTDWGFEQSEFDFDSHYIDGSAKVVGTNWKFSKVLSGNGNASWLTINIKDKNDGMGEWVNPTTIISGKYTLNIVDGKLRFNIQPMMYMKSGQLDPSGQFDETTYKQPVNYREMKIEVINTDNNQTQTVTVRQYAPIPVTVNEETFFMERFEEYESDKNGTTIYGLPWQYKDNTLNNLKDLYNSKVTYHWGNPQKNGVGLNSTYLKDKESAAYKCYQKGQSGVQQGAEVYYYALPSQAMMEAMFTMSATQETSWGPFEPMKIYEDYWTSTVEKETPTKTTFYNGSTKKYESTTERQLNKRVRTVYTVHQW